MYKPFKHDWVSALKQCPLLRLLCCRPSALRRCNKHKELSMCPPASSHHPQHLPALLTTGSPFASYPPAFLFYFFFVNAFCSPAEYYSEYYILQSSIQLPEPPSLLHPLHHLTPVRGQKLVSLMLTLSAAVRVWAGAALLVVGTGNQGHLDSWVWWQHFGLEFGDVDCSFPKEGLGYPWFKYPMSVFCGANVTTNTQLRRARGKANMIYRNTPLGYIIAGCVRGKKGDRRH